MQEVPCWSGIRARRPWFDCSLFCRSIGVITYILWVFLIPRLLHSLDLGKPGGMKEGQADRLTDTSWASTMNERCSFHFIHLPLGLRLGRNSGEQPVPSILCTLCLHPHWGQGSTAQPHPDWGFLWKCQLSLRSLERTLELQCLPSFFLSFCLPFPAFIPFSFLTRVFSLSLKY